MILFEEKGGDPSGLTFQSFLDDLNADYNPFDSSVPNDSGIADPIVPITCQLQDDVNLAAADLQDFIDSLEEEIHY